MTREEAIRVLEEFQVIDDWTMVHLPPMEDAVDMAIEALKEPTESTNTPTDTPTGLISKEDVKWQIQEWIAELNEAIDMLDSLPSADKPKSMIHIDEVYRLIAGHSNYHGDSILSAFTCLVEGKDVKPIAPLDESAEPKTGKWIIHDEVKNIYGGIYIECSECGTKFVTQTLEDERFCRNCGARMMKNGKG